MTRRRVPGLPDGSDHGARLYAIPWLDGVSEIVGVNRGEAIRVRDFHHPSVRGLPTAEEHGTGRCRSDGLTLRGLDVNAVVPSAGAAAAEP